MIRDICKDPLFLSLKSEPAGPGDLDTARDLLETLEAHREGLRGHGCQYDRRQQTHHRL